MKRLLAIALAFLTLVVGALLARQPPPPKKLMLNYYLRSTLTAATMN